MTAIYLPDSQIQEGPVKISPLTVADEPFLWTMLYHALYVPQGQPSFPAEIVETPEIRRYVQDWGRPDDLAVKALIENQPVGAAWLRLLAGENKGFGYVDDQTPELSLAVLPAYRGKGIGTRLLSHLLEMAQPRYAAICLSVSSENPAQRLYYRLGFEVVQKNGSSLTMVKRMNQ